MLATNRESELNRELVSRIAHLLGSAEKRATAIPRLTLHQRKAPTAACHVTYEPSVIVVAQGRKEVQIGANTLIYDPSRYLLTSVDLPTVTRVSEASESAPCFAASLKIDISVVREFLSREEFHTFDAPGTDPQCPPVRSPWSSSAHGVDSWICS